MNKRILVPGLMLPTIFALAACSEDKPVAPVEKVAEIKEEAAQVVDDTQQAVAEVVEETKEQVETVVNEATDHVHEMSTETVDEPKVEEEVSAPPAAEEETAAPSTTEVSAPPKNHEVKAAVTQFNPMVLFVNPGDTVTWTNMAGHDTTSIEGMIPEGAEAWQSKMGEQYSYTFTQEGAYIYKCTPHASLGMIAAVVVGSTNPANLDAIKALPENKGMVGRAIRKLNKAVEEKNK